MWQTPKNCAIEVVGISPVELSSVEIYGDLKAVDMEILSPHIEKAGERRGHLLRRPIVSVLLCRAGGLAVLAKAEMRRGA